MTELRERMIAAMRSAGLAASTQEIYLHSVRALAAYYRCSPAFGRPHPAPPLFKLRRLRYRLRLPQNSPACSNPERRG